MQKDQYYALLGLTPNCSPDQIKKAYKSCVKAWHPDRFAAHPTKQRQAEHKLKQINYAYDHLMRPGLHHCGHTQAPEDTPLQQAGLKPGTKWLMKVQSRIIQWHAFLTCALQARPLQGTEKQATQPAPRCRRAGQKKGNGLKSRVLADQPARFGHVLMRQLHPRYHDATPLDIGSRRRKHASTRIWMRLHLCRRRAGQRAEHIEPVAGIRSVAK